MTPVVRRLTEPAADETPAGIWSRLVARLFYFLVKYLCE